MPCTRPQVFATLRLVWLPSEFLRCVNGIIVLSIYLRDKKAKQSVPSIRVISYEVLYELTCALRDMGSGLSEGPFNHCGYSQIIEDLLKLGRSFPSYSPTPPPPPPPSAQRDLIYIIHVAVYLDCEQSPSFTRHCSNRTVWSRLTATSVIRLPHYYGHFIFFGLEKRQYIFL